ncbi:hypothetical protein C4553_02980 [Candidatus Parcubacteria bacterium]|nr:MAG: hypothetical protein C4553_02980 [Candidatus Parcubacteria bacterium]
MDPLLASKLSFLFGLVMIGAVVVKKYKILVTIPEKGFNGKEDESFQAFILNSLGLLKAVGLEILHVLQRVGLRFGLFFVHSLKLVSLKVESKTTKGLGRLRIALDRHSNRSQSRKKVIVMENQDDSDGQALANTIVATDKNPAFFKTLKDAPNHDKLKDKLSQLNNKGEGGGSGETNLS